MLHLHQQDVIDTFHTRLAAFTPLPDVAWEGVVYEPQQGRPYLRTKLSSYLRQGRGAGLLGAIEINGTWTCTVVRPADEGRKPAGQMAALLVTWFDRNIALLAANGLPIVIMDVTEQPAMFSGGWVQIPVVVTFVASF